MRSISVFFFTLATATTTLAALPLSAQLPPSLSSLSSQSSRSCSFGIDRVSAIISEILDESKTGTAMLKLESAKNIINEGDYKGCASYIDHAMRALRANDVATRPNRSRAEGTVDKADAVHN